MAAKPATIAVTVNAPNPGKKERLAGELFRVFPLWLLLQVEVFQRSLSVFYMVVP